MTHQSSSSSVTETLSVSNTCSCCCWICLAADFEGELENLRALVKQRANMRMSAFKKAQSIRADKMKADIAAAKAKKKAASVRFGKKSTDVVNSTRSSAGITPVEENAKEEDSDEELMPDGNVNLLVEVVSATDLPIADVSSTDPYVVVFMGKKEVHRTVTIPKT